MPLFGKLQLESATTLGGDRRVELELAKARPGPNRMYVQPTVAFLVEGQTRTPLAEMLSSTDGMIYTKKSATIRVFGDHSREIIVNNSQNQRWITDGTSFQMPAEPYGLEYAETISTELAIAVCMFAISEFGSSD